MAKTKKKENRRSRPPDEFIAAKRAEGYALAGDLAEEFELRPSTVYSWVATGKLVAPPRKVVSFKQRGCVWISIDAVMARAKPVAKAAS